MQKSNVSFGYYYTNYCMGQQPLLDAELFERYKGYAERFLDGICSADIFAQCGDEVKDCVCTIAERIFTEQKRDGIKNENTDGYSVAFEKQSPVRKQLLDIAAVYLGKKGLLYAGVE